MPARRPIPPGKPGTALDYGAVPILRGPRWDEPLVPLADHGIAGVAWYAVADGTNPPYGRPIEGAAPVLLARRTVAERLEAVNAALSADGLELFVFDAWRPLACQRGLWRHFEAELRRAHADADADTLRALVGQFVSDPWRFDPDDPSTWPTHSLGGAVDLTLRTLGGAALDMGTGFDDASERSHTAAFEAADGPVRRNRRRLYHALVDAGFVNYPLEWWHYDLDSQLAAFFANEPGRASVYGPIPA